MRPLALLRESEAFAAGLDHPEGFAFDGAAALLAGGELGQLASPPSQDISLCNSVRIFGRSPDLIAIRIPAERQRTRGEQIGGSDS